MVKDEKVGVGIVTCNRRESYSKLIAAVKSASDVDFVATVKNFSNDYGEDDPKIVCNGQNGSQKLASIQVDQKLGIAYNKNQAARWLLDEGAQHIFIVEDDILLKDVNVFREYIQTAKEFHLEHLNFCRAFDGMTTHQFLKPFGSIQGKTHSIDLFQRLCGDFSYFTRNALEKGGLYDEAYMNALDHCEHTYRMSMLGFYTPFFAFADISDSTRYIEDVGVQTSIPQGDEQKRNQSNAYMHFLKTYGKQLNEIPVPTQDQILRFLRNKAIAT